MIEIVYGILMIFMLIVLGVCIVPVIFSISDVITRPLKEENERNRKEYERMKREYKNKKDCNNNY